MAITLTCPGCNTRLRANGAITPGIPLRCPTCNESFSPEIDLISAPAPSLIGPSFFIAISVALILGSSLITAAVLLSSRRPIEQAPVVVRIPPEKKSTDEDLPKRDADRAEIERLNRRVELAILIAQGQAALLRKDHSGAEKAFEQAIKLDPDNPEARAGLVSAKARPAEEKQPAEAPAQQDAMVAEKQKQADFAKHMDNGKIALAASRFADAVREYSAAVRLMPDDLEAQQGQKQAETKLAGLADKEKRQAAFDDLIDRGRASLAGKRYKEALAILEPAARMMPDDRQGQRLLRDAREGLKTAKTSNARLLGLANDASRLGRYDEAQRLLEEATRNWPEDDVAEKALRNATRQMEAAQIAQANYLRYTQQGTLAMTAGRYAEAVAAFAEALRLAPLDLDVQRNLREARAALERDLRVRADYERLYRAGNLALVRRSFPEAIRAFTDALKLVPGDLPASEGLRKARYGKAILDGTVALKMRKKAEAVAAFEAALAEMPTDLAARQGLAQARSLR